MPISYDKTRKRYSYQLHRHVGGQRIRAHKILPPGWSRAQADEFDRVETARILAELHGLERRAASIEAAVHLYLTEHAVRLKSHRSILEDLAAVYGWYAGRNFEALPAISRTYAADALGRLDAAGQPDPLRPATIKKRIALLRAACRYAWKHHGMGESDPGARLYLPAVKNERQTYLDRRTVLRMVRAMAPDARGAALIAFYSGMRLSEILRARVRDGAFTLADTKNSTPRHIPIHPRIAVYARKGIRCRRAWIQRQFMRAGRALGIEAHFHDLRHSAASEMINNDVDLYTVGAVLGHKSAQSTQRYAHLAQTKLREAVGRIGQKIGSAK
jgi:integrase